MALIGDASPTERLSSTCICERGYLAITVGELVVAAAHDPPIAVFPLHPP
jgi:hypothetical protein